MYPNAGLKGWVSNEGGIVAPLLRAPEVAALGAEALDPELAVHVPDVAALVGKALDPRVQLT